MAICLAKRSLSEFALFEKNHSVFVLAVITAAAKGRWTLEGMGRSRTTASFHRAEPSVRSEALEIPLEQKSELSRLEVMIPLVGEGNETRANPRAWIYIPSVNLIRALWIPAI